MRWLMSLVLVLLAVPASAGALEDGLAAYQARDFDKAVKLLQPLADLGNPQAQRVIGRLYHRGKGLPKDADKAAQWYRKASAADPIWGKPLYKLGLDAMKKGNNSDATKLLSEVIAVDPTSPEAALAKSSLELLKK